MSDKTGISWTDATWNPIRGCSRVSEGCRNCYAERQAARIVRMGASSAYEKLVKLTAAGEPRWTGVVDLNAKTLAAPLRWRKPRRIFVNSMSDLFHESLTNEQIAAVFGVMAAAPRHTFQVITKRATRMRAWFAWITDGGEYRAWRRLGDHAEAMGAPVYVKRKKDGRSPWNDVNPSWPLKNVWLGVSVENQAAADERIPELLETPAEVRFLSCEPLIGPVDVSEYFDPCSVPCGEEPWPELDWIIAGCESGPGARSCDVAWLRSLRDRCAEVSVPFFLKQAVETDVGRCGDDDSRHPCGQKIRTHVLSEETATYACGCTIEGAELGAGVPLGAGDGSKRKAGGVIELPYLDGKQWAEFPAVPR